MTINVKQYGPTIYVRKTKYPVMYKNKAGIIVGRIITIYLRRNALLNMIL